MGKAVSKGKTNPQRKRIQHSKEFKLEALRQLALGEKSGTQLAMELGVARNHLYKWQAELDKKGKDAAFCGQGRKPLEERTEIERLQAELKRVTEERDILKKAAAYFAKELP
jgi:transposase